MPIINPTLPNDGEDIDAVDISGPILAILSVINGNIDEDNINLGSFTWAVMGTITNAIPVDAMVDAGNIRISRDETMWDHVASGLVITADAAGSTLLYSMTAGVVYINGRRLTVAADLNRAATASRDTYIDIIDNLDGTASVSRNAVTNNAASQALASNSIRIGIVVSGASSIAAATSINQGQPNRLLPIASNVPYTVSDSLGNLICNRSPFPTLLCLRRYATNQGGITANTALTGMLAAVNVPTATNVQVSGKAAISNTSATSSTLRLYEGTTTGGTLLPGDSVNYMPTTGTANSLKVDADDQISGFKNYIMSLTPGAGTATVNTSASLVTEIRVQRV